MSISDTALPTPILSSGQILPPQSPFLPFFSLYAGLTCPFRCGALLHEAELSRAVCVGLGLGPCWQSHVAAQRCRAVGKTAWTSFKGSFSISFGFCLRDFTIAGPTLQMCAWRRIIWVCLPVTCVLVLVQVSAVVEGEGQLRRSLLGACRPSWSSFLCPGPRLDSWLQALTVCRAGNIVLYAVVSFSEFKGREILSVLLCLHLGQ